MPLFRTGLFISDPSKIPAGANRDVEILRLAIVAELDAASLYEQMAELVECPRTKAVLLDVAKEEKTHVGEFSTLLAEKDPEQLQEMVEGQNEVVDITESISTVAPALVVVGNIRSVVKVLRD